ncbi:MAG: hypothetical protein IH874_08925 [Candidatus Dadabacteria bacterium]|nr:hypothetical protein [Candidatus Dadabacteria bacterium]
MPEMDKFVSFEKDDGGKVSFRLSYVGSFENDPNSAEKTIVVLKHGRLYVIKTKYENFRNRMRKSL